MSWQLTKSRDWAQLEAQFDFVRDMQNVPQDALHHTEGNVATHTQMVLAALESLPEYQQLPEREQNIVWAAALLHDVEKRSTSGRMKRVVFIHRDMLKKASYPREIFYFAKSIPHLQCVRKLRLLYAFTVCLYG